ncbi:MAG: hypothetical protein JXA11_16825 [Phycisphaerae bacterium]|nr:hypothetical protein [Phycisphaerae bacterium]
MIEQPDNFDLSDALGRYARGELGAAQIEELTRRVNSDPDLRSAWCEYQISRYIDGELTAEEVTDLTTRVQEDPELVSAMEEYKTLDAELSKLADDVPEFDFVMQREEILQSVERRNLRHRQRMQQWVLRPALATLAAAAVFVLAVGVYLMVRTEAPAPPEEFRVSLVPPAPAPTGEGPVRVAVLPGKVEIVKSSGSVVALAGAPSAETLARGVSTYMMFACCAGMPPDASSPQTAAPILQAFACLSLYLEQHPLTAPEELHDEL